MNILQWKEKTWRRIYEGQLIYTIALFGLSLATKPNNAIILDLVAVLGILILNIFQDKNKYLKIVTTWINIILIPSCLTNVWQVTGDLLLRTFPIAQTAIVWLMWLLYLPLLVPLVMISAKNVHNWFLRLVAFFSLDVLYNGSMLLNIKHAPILHTFNDQGVIAALATATMACFLAYSWGYRFNPNLKFRISRNFNWTVMITLVVLLVIDVWWNCFGGNGNTLWSILFSTEISKFDFTWPNFTSALEPGILEEMERYIWIIILLAGFNRFKKWRVPIAVYGSTLFFALTHLSNIGVHGQSVAGTISQVVAVTDAMAWAVAYLYSGKIWLIMLTHFCTDYFINLQEGWASTSTFSGNFADWATTIIPLIFGLAVTIWMMFGKRRQVMEENVDRLLNIE